jgi:hypothetical protein
MRLTHSPQLYMGHGGTNFGFWNGANAGNSPEKYQPDITSCACARARVCVCCAVLRMHAYSQLTHTPDDYDAPVSEDGSDGYGSDGVNKFDALKDAIAKVGGRILWVCVSIRACRRRQAYRRRRACRDRLCQGVINVYVHPLTLRVA